MVTTRKTAGRGAYAAAVLASRVNDKRVKSSLTDRIKGLKSPPDIGSPSRFNNATPLLQGARRNLLSNILPSSSVRAPPSGEVPFRLAANEQQQHRPQSPPGNAPLPSRPPIMRGRTSLLDRLQQHKQPHSPSRIAGSSSKNAASAHTAFTFAVPLHPASTSKQLNADKREPQMGLSRDRTAPDLTMPAHNRGRISNIHAAADETAAAIPSQTERFDNVLKRRNAPIHAPAPVPMSSSQARPLTDAETIRNIGRQSLMSLLADVSSSPSSSLSNSQQTGRGINDSSFDSTTLLDLKSLNLAVGIDKTSKGEQADVPANKYEAEAEQELHKAKKLGESLSDELERSIAEEVKAQDESSRVAYQRITHLVRGFVTISEAIHTTFQAAVSRNQSFEKDVAELSDVMAAAHVDIFEQMGQTIEKIREVINRIREEQERYEAQRSAFLSTFRKKAKEQFSKYESDRDELFRIVAAINDTKASEKQVRSTVMSLIQSL
ncbi:hypothetical protein OC846_002512 [Tilletia horrida]|uniref:Uncharacterized protein n=1 Tax=Tilletia horrida TaxID=155126 RepID=A0AAN6GWX0_9BASI|nr:hypothetical protein OC845_003365 [Tilletia horrida]KAK0553463.1 hypothetical protein OC846_002512 [Tilletia horrida]KAK0568003.1 hypothetical protein OC861_002385 [Tilletia horrida]